MPTLEAPETAKEVELNGERRAAFVSSFRASEEDSSEEHIIEGIAVPYETETKIGSYFREKFAKGSVTLTAPLLFWRHAEPIGKILEGKETAEGFWIRAKISKTPRGEEAYTLAKDGVISSMSVGFRSLSHTISDEESETPLVTRNEVEVFEVSLVPHPAYQTATVTQVREKEGVIMPNAIEELSNNLDDLSIRQNSLEALVRELPRTEESPKLHRSAGSLLKAIVAGDEAAVEEYREIQTRAFADDANVLADSVVKDSWVGDLTRIPLSSNDISRLFATAPLPKEGMKVEFGELDTNTIKVEKQTAEGATLAKGKVTLKTRTADVETYGGTSSLSRQVIERSSVSHLNTVLKALHIAAEKARRTQFETFFAAQVTAQASNAVTVSDSTSLVAWIGGLIDAAEKFDEAELDLQNLIVSKDVFKDMATATDQNGRPLMVTYGTGMNAFGEIKAKGLAGDIAGTVIRPSFKLEAETAAFVNELAITQWLSPIAQLSDEDITNLTKEFGVYRYGAIGATIPNGIVPVSFGTSGE